MTFVREVSPETMHTLRRETPSTSERNPIGCLSSHQSEKQRFSQVEKEISQDWRHIETTQARHDAAHRREDRLAQVIAPANPDRVGRNGQPGADDPNEQRDLEDRERRRRPRREEGHRAARAGHLSLGRATPRQLTTELVTVDRDS